MLKYAFLLLAIFAVCLAPVFSFAQEVPASRPQIALTFAPLVKQAAPAVVNIYTQRLVQQRLSPFEDPAFQQFFGNAMPPGMNRQRMDNSLGSGVIVRSDGLIVTSNHVINGAEQIRVVLTDRREFDAVLLTADEHSDLAVLRIDNKGEKLPYVELKDSDEAEVGDLVLAIGNPFGVGQTVTSGIISAITHRAVGSSGDLDYFLQTDAAINPGNSGGALIAMDGRLVGINSAIYTKTGGNMGIGFAVPSNVVRVLLSAVEHGQKNIVRPWIGIEGQAVTAALAASLNMAQPSGLLVNRIHPASPAALAGVQAGDVIVAINGRPVEDAESFRYRLGTTSVGSSVLFSILRKGQKLDVSVHLIAPPEDPPRQRARVTGLNPLGGAEIENLSPAVSEETGIRNLEHGIIVSDVKEGAAAANVGIQPGDIILSINGTKLTDVNSAIAILQAPATSWRVAIQRGEEKMTILVGD